jgi:predicted PhzF superfamily epimerase YddE/YHI9
VALKIPIFQVDAFTSEVFRGNPAAVCVLQDWLDDATMLAIAAENNLSETAFLVRESGGYKLRWFAPRYEVQLCGHATLASAMVVLTRMETSSSSVIFETRSGSLTVSRDGDLMVMDFPALPLNACPSPPPAVLGGIEPHPRVVLRSGASAPEGNYFVVYEDEADVRDVRIDLGLLKDLHPSGVCVTAPGRDSDFVSRYFAPSFGIPEDPVTGSTHCSLALYWSERLGKESLHARQLSSRGGELWVEPRGERVLLKGRAVMYMEGTINV